MKELKWFEKAGKAVTFAKVLLEAGAFRDKVGIIRYFEKPWKKTPEYELWKEMGKPTIDNKKEWNNFLEQLNEAKEQASRKKLGEV